MCGATLSNGLMGARRSGIHQLIAIPSLRVVLGAVLLFWLVGTTCRNGNPPDTPQAPVGPTRWPVGLADTFSVTTYDPEGDRVRYVFDWGDGSQDSTGYRNGGVPVRAWHAWTTGGAHYVKARAYDQQGHGSDWSEATPVTIVGYPHRVVATIPVGSMSFGLAALPSGEYVYVSIIYTDTVRVIRTSDNVVVATIVLPGGPNGSDPMGLASLPNGDYVYVACYLGFVAVIRTSDNTVVATVPVDYGTWNLEASPTGDYVYVACTCRDRIAVIRTSDNVVVDWISVEQNPVAVAPLPDGEYFYVTHAVSTKVLVIRTLDSRVVATIPVGDYGEVSGGIAAHPNGECVYVTSGGRVSAIRTADNTVTTRFRVGEDTASAWLTDLAVTGDGNYAYVSRFDDRSVSIIRTLDNSILSRVRVGDGPRAVVTLPGGERVYVANAKSGTVSVIGY